jgi:hypothetical protein
MAFLKPKICVYILPWRLRKAVCSSYVADEKPLNTTIKWFKEICEGC